MILFKICLKLIKIILLSILIYSCYMLLTPLQIELLPYFVIFVFSLFILTLYELFIFIIKKRLEGRRKNN